MKRILFFTVVLSFLLLRPYKLQNGGPMYVGVNGDDYSYAAHSAALVFLKFPDYSNEKITFGQFPMHSIGPAVLAAPFVAVFSVLDRWKDPSVYQERTEANVDQSWFVFGFQIATIFYFFWSMLLLYRLACRWTTENYASWAVVLLVLVQGVPLFVYRRPVFSHVYEFFAMVVWLTFLFSRKSNGGVDGVGTGKFKTQDRQAILLGGISAMVGLIRYNNAPMAVFLPLVWLRKHTTQKGLRFLAVWAGVFGVLCLIFKVWPTLRLGEEKYAGNINQISRVFSWDFYLLRFWGLIAGWDWGLVFTAPFSLLGFGYLFRLKGDDARILRWAAVPLLVNLYICIVFGSQGGWYGYRYLFFTWTPFALLGLCKWLEAFGSRKWVPWVLGAFSVPPILSMLLFEGNPTTLTLAVIQQLGHRDWGNLTYQLEVWKTVLFAPKEAIVAITKGGPAYIGVVARGLLDCGACAPAALYEKYQNHLDLLILLKSLLVWGAFPMIYGVWRVVVRKCKCTERVS